EPSAKVSVTSAPGASAGPSAASTSTVLPAGAPSRSAISSAQPRTVDRHAFMAAFRLLLGLDVGRPGDGPVAGLAADLHPEFHEVLELHLVAVLDRLETPVEMVVLADRVRRVLRHGLPVAPPAGTGLVHLSGDDGLHLRRDLVAPVDGARAVVEPRARRTVAVLPARVLAAAQGGGALRLSGRRGRERLRRGRGRLQ